ncbi:hypothetical protein [Pseudomonas fluorescens]|uniref:Uncharacterized protein n=1 Tax=Pseudomonas fluorescens TaxID=294 RepID=A0A5E7VLH5_PSEFL|nr:hypothetical protein [Pseudomonas fluorescens]VVQ23579.1 hypothetical protein PS928_05565 [Pseudomonas fluorescens]
MSALIRECFDFDFADIFSKPQVLYLFKYLKELKAEGVLLEPEYIDREFLEDFSNYYVKRFGNNGYVCSRLHFFKCQISHKDMDEFLLGKPSAKLTAAWLQENYLGFMVVKPMTKTFVGKTCLQVIGDPNLGAGVRKKIARRYSVSLFGIDLYVDSIAFQEQDKVVAACATTAVWTALHAFPGRDVRSVTSCSEITTAALNYADNSGNGFPNIELSNEQIQRALDVEGLRYHATKLKDLSADWFAHYVTAHVDSNVPVILTGMVYGLERGVGRRWDVEKKAGHAITMLGYDFREGSRSIYMHDDRLGPYARAQIVSLKRLLGADTPQAMMDAWVLAIYKRSDSGVWEKRPHEFLLPEVSVALADKKARLAYTYAYKTAERIKEEMDKWMTKLCAVLKIDKQPLNHAIQLVTVSEARQGILAHDASSQVGNILENGPFRIEVGDQQIERWSQEKIKLLTSHIARWQWQIDFLWGDVRIFRILLDATDIPAGNAVSGIFIFDLIYGRISLGAFQELLAKPDPPEQPHFFNAFLKSLKRGDDDYASNLLKKYGALRAPNYLKDDEVSDTGVGKNRTTKSFYDPSERRLRTLFGAISKDKYRNLIWAIGKDGILYVAEDIMKPVVLGHPSMTGLQPARIAGEMWCEFDGKKHTWFVNSESGRYSRDYSTPEVYLANAIRKISSIFPGEKFILGGKRPRTEDAAASITLVENPDAGPQSDSEQ